MLQNNILGGRRLRHSLYSEWRNIGSSLLCKGLVTYSQHGRFLHLGLKCAAGPHNLGLKAGCGHHCTVVSVTTFTPKCDLHKPRIDVCIVFHCRDVVGTHGFCVGTLGTVFTDLDVQGL